MAATSCEFGLAATLPLDCDAVVVFDYSYVYVCGYPRSLQENFQSIRFGIRSSLGQLYCIVHLRISRYHGTSVPR